jgi:glucosamine kinase
MILIADSGSTKTSWCLIDDKAQRQYFDTEGYNPYFVGAGDIVRSLGPKLPDYLAPAALHQLYFYGAGCFEDKAGIVRDALQQLFPGTDITVELDLLAAARAVLGHHPGFAAILGTGTNTCLYDGKAITANIDSLGYILGDEGSGCHIGKLILADYIRDYMPPEVRKEFFEAFGLSREEIMHLVYTQPMANRFCAGFSHFLKDQCTDRGYSRKLIHQAFSEFFERLVVHYPCYRDLTFNCVGSIGYIYRPILEEVADSYGMQVGTILQHPITGLAGYHTPGS